MPASRLIAGMARSYTAYKKLEKFKGESKWQK